jgi:PilZ domain
MGAPELMGRAGIGQRDGKRSRVLLAAKLKTKHGEVEARLRDLSRKGALVECDDNLKLGEELVFVRGATVVPARIAWTGGNRIGLEFLKPIQEAEVLVHVKRIAAASTGKRPSDNRYRRPRLSSGLSDYERKLAHVIGTSLGVKLIDD